MDELSRAPPIAVAEPATRGFLTFRTNGRLYALPASDVAEIIVMPPVVRLPQSPKALLGLANLRGSVIAVAGLGALLGLEAEPSRSCPRAIVLNGPSPIAVSVDAVERLLRVETWQSNLGAEPGEALHGAFQDPADASIVKILDLPALLSRAFVPRKPAAGGPKLSNRAAYRQAAAPSQTQALVTFEVGGQPYALPLREVREIIAIPAAIAMIPHSEALVAGLTAYKDGLLPLLRLRGLLGFPPAGDENGESNPQKIVVTTVGGMPVGLIADRMGAIVQAPAPAITPAPALLAARAGGESKIGSIYHDEGRLISILATEKLFGDEVMAKLGSYAPAAAAPAPAPAPGIGARQLQFLVFGLGNEEFALPIGVVREVAALPETITRLPRTPEFLAGVVNLRGEVLPVIDQRSRFGLPKFDAGQGRQRLVVIQSVRHLAGLIVDGISEILTLPAEAVDPAPQLAGEETRLVRGVLNLGAAGRLILILDPDELLTRAERSLLDEFNAVRKPGAKAAGKRGGRP